MKHYLYQLILILFVILSIPVFWLVSLQQKLFVSPLTKIVEYIKNKVLETK
jgi:hypothetical protein